MKINLKWHDPTHVQISVEEPNEYLWDDARGFFPNLQPNGNAAFLVPYYELINLWSGFWGHFSNAGVEFFVEPKLVADVREFIHNQEGVTRNFTADQLVAKLESTGFKRQLKDFQVENVCKLSRRNQGATFSVPGAGKTTEALAFFYATADITDKLLVVAPLNAFGAWDEQLADCMQDSSLSFVRLTGGVGNVQRLLREDHRFLLTNYEFLRSAQPNECIRRFLSEHRNVYVFLDESHKIKNDRTAQAEAIKTIQCLPKAKLIMSGTPMPQSPRDLLTQYQFLFPDRPISEMDVVDKFKDVYVRTTASRLGIPDIVTHKHSIEMDDIERELYRKMRRISLDAAGQPSNDARYLRQLGKSVMRLMAFVSNPALVANHFAAVLPELPSYLRSKDSQKIAYVCRRVRELVRQGKKVLIWSCFVKNVELISRRLVDLGADFIHGGVKAGDPNDPTSREGKIRRFHDSGSRHMVLVANPAAASEGISLHKACQYAIYVDRSFNAAHFLQSQDRIHRLGLPENTVPEIELVTCTNTIDDLVEQRLRNKITVMGRALNDPSIIPTSPNELYDEENEDGPDVDSTDSGISQEDVAAILRHLRGI